MCLVLLSCDLLAAAESVREYVKRVGSIHLDPTKLLSDAPRQCRVPQPEPAGESDAQGGHPGPGMGIAMPAVAKVLGAAWSCGGHRQGRRTGIGSPGRRGSRGRLEVPCWPG